MNLPSSWRSRLAKAKLLLVAGLILLLGWVSTPAMAQAAAFDSDQVEYLSGVFDRLDNRANPDLDSLAGAGSSAQLEGKLDRATGVIQENLGKARNDLGQQAEGSLNRAKANAKESAGSAASHLDSAASDATDSNEGLIDKVQDFFNH